MKHESKDKEIMVLCFFTKIEIAKLKKNKAVL